MVLLAKTGKLEGMNPQRPHCNNCRNMHLPILHTQKTSDTFSTQAISTFLLCSPVSAHSAHLYLNMALPLPPQTDTLSYQCDCFLWPWNGLKVTVMLVFRTIPHPATRQGERCGSERKNQMGIREWTAPKSGEGGGELEEGSEGGVKEMCESWWFSETPPSHRSVCSRGSKPHNTAFGWQA